MIRQASVQDVSWFIDLDRLNRLNLDPPYQRRSVWTAKDRKFFLDTILRNYPCPPVFIHKTIDENGIATYNVVDGKQRLLTILDFSKNKIALDKEFGDERLNGKRFKQLDPEARKKFWNYNIPVDFIDIPDGLDINEVFDRVNRNSRNLLPQELRHARFDGWFIKEAEAEADDDPFWLEVKITTRGKAKRMKNVQLVSEILLVLIEKRIVGFSQDHLDEMYAKYDTIVGEDGEPLVLDVDEYNVRKGKLKAFIRAMEAENNCITTHATTANNVYPLFALVILKTDENTDAISVARNYHEFMSVVDDLKGLEDPESSLQERGRFGPQALRYLRNSVGAATEPEQRKERLEALEESILS